LIEAIGLRRKMATCRVAMYKVGWCKPVPSQNRNDVLETQNDSKKTSEQGYFAKSCAGCHVGIRFLTLQTIR